MEKFLYETISSYPLLCLAAAFGPQMIVGLFLLFWAFRRTHGPGAPRLRPSEIAAQQRLEKSDPEARWFRANETVHRWTYVLSFVVVLLSAVALHLWMGWNLMLAFSLSFSLGLWVVVVGTAIAIQTYKIPNE